MRESETTRERKLRRRRAIRDAKKAAKGRILGDVFRAKLEDVAKAKLEGLRSEAFDQQSPAYWRWVWST